MVKGKICLVHPGPVVASDCLFHHLDARFKPGYPLGKGAICRDRAACCDRLQGGANLAHPIDAIFVEFDDPHAAILLARDDALRFERLQRLSQWHPADCELSSQLNLDEALSGAQCTGCNTLDDRIRNLIGEAAGFDKLQA
jgi:hypothetical protein